MTDADRDRAEGAFDKAKGNVKEGLGELRNDDDQKAEGQADQAKGGLKEKLGDAKDAVSDVIDDVRKKN